MRAFNMSWPRFGDCKVVNDWIACEVAVEIFSKSKAVASDHWWSVEA